MYVSECMCMRAAVCDFSFINFKSKSNGNKGVIQLKHSFGSSGAFACHFGISQAYTEKNVKLKSGIIEFNSKKILF